MLSRAESAAGKTDEECVIALLCKMISNMKTLLPGKPMPRATRDSSKARLPGGRF